MASDAAVPSVSVLVPVYNVERYLRQCLDSLAAQTMGDFEVICINDGSTDGSRKIIEGFAERDARFRVIDKENSGYGASMNRGLDAARGSYVAILESDDFFEPSALELLLSEARSSGASVVKANFWLHWTQPEERSELFRVVDGMQAASPFRPLDDVALFFRKPTIWSALYERSLLVDEGIRFLETPGASYQDAGFSFKVWAANPLVSCIEDPALFYRQDNEQSSVNSRAKAYCVCDEYASMARFVEGRPSDAQKRLWGILSRMKFDSYLWNIDRLAPHMRGEFVGRMASEFSEDLAAGKVDASLFEPGAHADLMLLVEDPERFCEIRSRLAASGGRDAVGHYLAVGGVPLLARVLLHKAFGRSVRRTNERGASL